MILEQEAAGEQGRACVRLVVGETVPYSQSTVCLEQSVFGTSTKPKKYIPASSSRGTVVMAGTIYLQPLQ